MTSTKIEEDCVNLYIGEQTNDERKPGGKKSGNI